MGILLDTHLIADTAHALDAAGNFDGTVDLALIVDEATELDFAFTRYRIVITPGSALLKTSHPKLAFM